MFACLHKYMIIIPNSIRLNRHLTQHNIDFGMGTAGDLNCCVDSNFVRLQVQLRATEGGSAQGLEGEAVNYPTLKFIIVCTGLMTYLSSSLTPFPPSKFQDWFGTRAKS